MGGEPRSSYPPDLPEDAKPVAEFGSLVDTIVENADWANRRELGLTARRIEVRSSRFTGAELGEASLVDATFIDCRLDLVGLRHAKLERVAFRDCRLSECDLYGASLKDVVFERCELREATLTAAELERVELRGCELTGLRGAEALRGVRMPWSDVMANAPLFASALGIEMVD